MLWGLCLPRCPPWRVGNSVLPSRSLSDPPLNTTGNQWLFSCVHTAHSLYHIFGFVHGLLVLFQHNKINHYAYRTFRTVQWVPLFPHGYWESRAVNSPVALIASSYLSSLDIGPSHSGCDSCCHYSVLSHPGQHLPFFHALSCDSQGWHELQRKSTSV